MNEILARGINLVKAIRDSDVDMDEKNDDIRNVKDYLESFPRYLNSVISYAIASQMIRILYDGENYRDRMKSLDENRRRKHIAATDAVNKLNTIARYYEVKEIIPIGRRLDSNSVDDREYAVKLTYDFCTSVFLDEIERSGYNIGKGESADQELLHMIEKGGGFHTDLSLEEEDYEL